MLGFLARRIVGLLPQLLGVSFLAYLLISLAPGNFCNKLLDNPKVSKREFEECVEYYGFGKPFAVRYGLWLGHVARGDFGKSYQYGLPVFSLIRTRVVNTLTLTLSSLVVAWGLALLFGTAAAVRSYSWVDKTTGLLAYAGLSVPAVFLSLLMLLFAYTTKLFPIGDLESTNYDDLGAGAQILDRLWHLALPTCVLAFTSMAGYMRQMRSSMLETLQQDFIRTARAKGLAPGRVVFKHAFVNAVNPLITIFGYSLGSLLAGSFLVEYVMNWPGMARLTVEAVQKGDEPLVLASVLMAATLLVAGNLAADLLLALSDPRIRLEGS